MLLCLTNSVRMLLCLRNSVRVLLCLPNSVRMLLCLPEYVRVLLCLPNPVRLFTLYGEFTPPPTPPLTGAGGAEDICSYVIMSSKSR